MNVSSRRKLELISIVANLGKNFVGGIELGSQLKTFFFEGKLWGRSPQCKNLLYLIKTEVQE